MPGDSKPKMEVQEVKEQRSSGTGGTKGQARRVKLGNRLDKEATKRALQPHLYKMLELSKCLECKRIPSPYIRFICPDGHIYCGYCGMQRCEEAEEVCNALTELKPKTETTTGPSGGGAGSAENSCAEGSVACAKKIERYPADPLYTAMFLKATWKCPNFVADGTRCKEICQGADLYSHLSLGLCYPAWNGVKEKDEEEESVESLSNEDEEFDDDPEQPEPEFRQE